MKKALSVGGLVAAWLLFLCPLAQAASDMELRLLQEKVNNLEKTVSEMSLKNYDKQGSVQTFLAESISFGGFFENSITSIWGPDTRGQTVADNHRLGINLAADLQPRVRVVAQYTMGFSYAFRNEHNNPSHGSALVPASRSYEELTYGSLLSQGFGEYDFSDSFKLQMGMGYTPFGRAYQVRDPVLFLKRRGPQMIRTSGLSREIIADPFWKGIHVLGALSSDKRWNYNLYTTSALDHSGKLGGGARVWWSPGEKLTLGASWQSGGQAGEIYSSHGADASWQGQHMGFIVEYARMNSDQGDPQSYYAQAYVKFFDETLVPFIDADYLKNPLGQTTLGAAAVNDPYIKWEYTTGVNYYFTPNAKVRWDIIFHDYTGNRAVIAGQDRDYFSTSLSSGFSF